MYRHTGCLGRWPTLDQAESSKRKIELGRMAAMLSRLGGRGYCVKEEYAVYGPEGIDFDPDSDFDLDEEEAQQATQAYGGSAGAPPPPIR